MRVAAKLLRILSWEPSQPLVVLVDQVYLEKVEILLTTICQILIILIERKCKANDYILFVYLIFEY